MSEERPPKPQRGMTDWDALAKMTDDDIDTSDAPALDSGFWNGCPNAHRDVKSDNFVQLDNDVSDFFEAEPGKIDDLVHRVLRHYIAEQVRRSESRLADQARRRKEELAEEKRRRMGG